MNWEKTTDLEFGGSFIRCVMSAWILADVWAEGDNGYIRLRDILGIGCDEVGGVDMSISISPGVLVGDW